MFNSWMLSDRAAKLIFLNGLQKRLNHAYLNSHSLISQNFSIVAGSQACLISKCAWHTSVAINTLPWWMLGTNVVLLPFTGSRVTISVPRK